MAGSRALAPCGTSAAYKRHRRRGEVADDACVAAHRTNARERRRSGRFQNPPPVAPTTYQPPLVEVGPACVHLDVDPSWFFSIDEFDRPDLSANQRQNLTTQNYRKARKVCGGCPIREQCLADNLDVEYGIFGGMGMSQRKRLRATQNRPPFFESNVTS